MFRHGISALRSAVPRSAFSAHVAKRYLNLHEYQSAKLMTDFGVKVPTGAAAATPAEARQIAENLGGGSDGTLDFVVKGQVLAGGRGLGKFDNGFQGGVHIAGELDEVEDLARNMLGHRLFTKQTGAEGKICNQVYVVERKYLRRETYFAILMDRSTNGPCIVASPKGGVDIEGVAATNPEFIYKLPVDIHQGIDQEKLIDLAGKMGFSKAHREDAAAQMTKLYDLFVKCDATLVEVNPFAETPEGEVLAVDAKINFDDNASYRQGDVFSMRDVSQEDPREVEASNYDLNYIGLDGNIGCLVNGAGLAMATMDIIKLHGGEPANFLDVGGGASEKQVEAAFKILNDDPKVEAILVNIFGGIMRCDVIAQGIVQAAHHINMRVPIVARLQGTRVEQAKQILDSSNLKIIPADDLDQAARKAVKMSEIVRMSNEMQVNVDFHIPI